MATLIEDIKDMKLYKKNFYLPMSDKDTKTNSAIYLLTTDTAYSNKLMNYKYTINRNKFVSYYTEKDLSYIISKQKITTENGSLFTEQEENWFNMLASSNEPIAPSSDGEYDSNNIWNSRIVLDGKNYRERCEALIFNDKHEVFALLYGDNGYRIPGGSTNISCSIRNQLRNECREEVHMNIKNIQYIKTYKKDYKYFIPNNKLSFKYDGTINHLFIAEFNNFYNGFVNYFDRDNELYNKGKFYSIDELKNNAQMSEHHMDAIDTYLYSIEALNHLNEEALTSKEKKKLDDSEYGLPYLRKYPLNDEAHVKLAIKFFNYCENKHKEELANNINKAIKKFNIKDINVGPNNTFKKYYDVK